MKVLLFGATGMVGQGVLRECLLDWGVERVMAVAATGTDGTAEAGELVVPDVGDLGGSKANWPGTTPASSASASRPSGWRRRATRNSHTT